MLALPCNFRRVLENTGPNSLGLSLSLSLSSPLLLFSYVAPCILPLSFASLDLPLATLYPPQSTNSLSGRRRHSLRISDGGSGIHARRANLYLLFRWNLRHTAIRRIFWSNCSPREKRSFVKYASHSSDCNRRMRNACESTPSPDSPVYWMKRRNSTVPFLPLISPPSPPCSFGGRSWSWN